MLFLKEAIRSVGEILRFFWSRKRWWLIPMILLLLLAAGLIMLGSASGIGPIIYTLF
jgi:hypothetical protein